jgi:hydrogenase-4 component F
MVAAVNAALPVLVIALPFAAAVALSLIGSWRVGSWINAAASTLLFVLAGLLAWQVRGGPRHAAPSLLLVDVAAMHLVLLTSGIAVTTSWFNRRYTPDALAARSLDRRSARLHHVGSQSMIGAILLALLSDNPVLTWLAMAVAVAGAAMVVGAVRSEAAAATASRLLLLTSAGLMLALLGTLLLYLAVEPHEAGLRWSTLAAGPVNAAALQVACIFLVVGYGALAGLVPMHRWLTGAASDGAASGAILITLMVNAPLLVFMRLDAMLGWRMAGIVLTVLGLATLLLGGARLLVRSDAPHMIGFAGMAQIGIIAAAIGIGGAAANFAAMLHMTLLSLARASVLQCEGLPPSALAARTGTAGILLLALVPLFALFVLVGTVVEQAAWLLLPLAAGVLMTSLAMLARLPASPSTTPRGNSLSDVALLTPVWLQLALVVVLALAMPGAVAAWFAAAAAP